MGEPQSSKVNRVPPSPLAMMVCDAVVRDPATSKSTLCGCFTTIAAKVFPATHPVLWVYVALTDGHGKNLISLRLVDADETLDPIFEMQQETEFKEPRVVLEMCFVVQNVVFPVAGEYRLQLHADGQHVIERRIVVMGLADNTAGGGHA